MFRINTTHSCAAAPLLCFLWIFFLLVLPSLPYPNGEVTAKSMFFSDSTLTRNEGEFTNLFPTLYKICINQLPNMSLSNHHSGMMNGFCLLVSEDDSLQSSFHHFVCS